MDEQLARQDSEVSDWLDRFVCVRIVQAYGLDLNLFQFDMELTFAVFFLNADRTIYGRYGSRFSHEGEESVSLEGIKLAMQSALDLHAGYPANKASLVGKTGQPPAVAKPELIPHLPGWKSRADGSRGQCIHCHQVLDAKIFKTRLNGKTLDDKLLWPYANPAALGMEFDPKKRASLSKVVQDSPAGRTGLKSGDDIITMAGQPIISVADVQWVLEQSLEPASIPIRVRRGKDVVESQLAIPTGWRRADDFTWRVFCWPIRNRLIGFRTAPISDEVRSRMKLPAEKMALRIAELPPNWLRERNRSPTEAGLKKNDVLIAVDGITAPWVEKDLLAYFMQKKRPKDRVRLTVLRGEQRLEIDIETQ